MKEVRLMGNINHTFVEEVHVTPLVKSDAYWKRMVTINGTVKSPKFGEWTYINKNITLNHGDTVCYWVYIETHLLEESMKFMGMYCEFYVDKYPNGTLFYTELFYQ